MGADIVQVIADVLAVVDRERLAVYLHDSYGPQNVRAAVDETLARLRELRDVIARDREAFAFLGRASAVFSDGTGYKIALTDETKARESVAAERALLTLCREVGS